MELHRFDPPAFEEEIVHQLPGVARDVKRQARAPARVLSGKGMAPRWQFMKSRIQVSNALAVMSKGKLLDIRLARLPLYGTVIPESVAIGPFHRIASHAEIRPVRLERLAAHFFPKRGEIRVYGGSQHDPRIRRPCSRRARRPRL